MGTNPDLSQRIQDFDNKLENISAAQICDINSKNSQNDYDMMEYKVLKCLIEDNYDSLLRSFGIDKNKAIFEVERFLGTKIKKEQQRAEPQVQKSNALMQSNLPSMTAEGAADFFSQLGQKEQP
jgi:hypothetical protein